MVTIGVAQNVQVHSVTPGCDACGAVLPSVPVEVAEQWLEAHRAPALLVVDLTCDGKRSTWRRRR